MNGAQRPGHCQPAESAWTEHAAKAVEAMTVWRGRPG